MPFAAWYRREGLHYRAAILMQRLQDVRPLATLAAAGEAPWGAAGELVKIKLRSPFEGRRNFQGLLRGAEEQDVVVLVDDHEYLLPIDLIDKANIIPRFD